jgi:tRNA pseudouridine55 synthase
MSTSDPSGRDGLILVDKPGGWTSHDVVARVRKLAGTRRVGHAGTLDPMATGVLVLGVGRATRLLGHLSLAEKEYDATVRLGVRTTTDDAEGEVVEVSDMSKVAAVGDRSVAGAIAGLTGDIEQVPSTVSAVKVGGVRAYRLARAGAEVALPPRRVTVSAFDLLDRSGSDLEVRVVCSSGTYVRALARDLGAALGVGAHLTRLRRTRVGSYSLARTRTLEQLAEELAVTSLADAVAAAFPRYDTDEETATRLAHGQHLELPELPAGVVGVFAPDGDVVGLFEERDGVARALAVFRQPPSPG